MKFSGIPVVVDPDMPPGTIELRSTVADAAGVVRLQLGGDELLAEEITSIGESSPFLVRIESCTEPIRRECCGTWVTILGEARPVPTSRGHRSRASGRPTGTSPCESTRCAGAPGWLGGLAGEEVSPFAAVDPAMLVGLVDHLAKVGARAAPPALVGM